MNNIVEAFVNDFKIKNDMIKISGILDDQIKDLKLIIKKRNSKKNISFKAYRNGSSWSVLIPFSELLPDYGVWDYYLSTDDDTYRLKVHKKNDLSLSDAPLIINNIAVNIEHYVTIKNSLSFKAKSPSVSFTDLLVNKNNNSVEITASLKLEHINNYSSIKINIIDRITKNQFEFNVNSFNVNEYTETLSFYINYEKLIQNKFTTNKWDVYLSLSIKDKHHNFRIKTDSLTLKEDTSIEWNNGSIFHMYFFPTIHNNLSISMSSLNILRDMDTCSLENGLFKGSGFAYLDLINYTNKDNIQKKLVIHKRGTTEKFEYLLDNTVHDKLDSTHYKFSGFSFEIPLKELTGSQPSYSSLYDVFIQLTYKQFTLEKKLNISHLDFKLDHSISSDTIKVRKGLRTYFIINKLLLTPFNNLKIESFILNKQKFNILNQNKSIYENYENSYDIWLIGEYPDSAQDTGFHFFKFCRKYYPNLKVYYVINKSSPNLNNVKPLGNIVYFGSKQHFKLSAIAKVFIGSHDVDYVIPTKGEDWSSYQQGERIFIQHGVLGRKNIHYYKRNYHFPFTKFLVSSKHEKDLVVKKMGYSKKDVHVTGLSRFDNLLTNHKTDNIILVIPTWRDYITSNEKFVQSKYFQTYDSLLQNKKLIELLKKHNFKMIFYPHYRMQPYIERFRNTENEFVEFIKFGEVDVQSLLKKAKIMITDYSSVSFDFNYMKKPIIFYHFDYNDFFHQGILRPPNETFLGDICITEDEVVYSVMNILKNSCKESQEVSENKDLIFENIDQMNCKRIMNVISNNSISMN